MTEYENIEDEEHFSRFSGQRSMMKNRMERQIRQTRMWMERFRAFARFIILLLLIAFGYFVLKSPNWYLNKSVFATLDNPYLEILNNKIVPSNKILAALRRSEIPNVAIYRLNTNEIRQKVLQIGPVENAYVRRFWHPARLQIIVEERTPILTISPAENVAPIAFFTKGGNLIGREYMPLDKSIKTYLVLSYGTNGDDYRRWDEEKVKLIEKIGKSVELNSGENVEFIDFRNPKDVYVKIKTVNIRLGKPDDTVFARIQRIPSILPQIKMLDKNIKYLDLRWKDANYIKLGE